MKQLKHRLPFYKKPSLVMLLKRATLALFATRALFPLASPVNSFTLQVTLQDSSIPLKSDDTCDSQVPAPSSKSQDPQVNVDAATFFGIARGETHQFLGIPFAYSP